MRIGAAAREFARNKAERSPSPGYDYVSRDPWLRRFRYSPLPAGDYFWYKARDTLWWLTKITWTTTIVNHYVVRFLDDPRPLQLTLSPARCDANQDAPCRAWCLQIHRHISFMRGLQRNIDESRGTTSTSTTPAPTPN